MFLPVYRWIYSKGLHYTLYSFIRPSLLPLVKEVLATALHLPNASHTREISSSANQQDIFVAMLTTKFNPQYNSIVINSAILYFVLKHITNNVQLLYFTRTNSKITSEFNSQDNIDCDEFSYISLHAKCLRGRIFCFISHHKYILLYYFQYRKNKTDRFFREITLDNRCQKVKKI